MNEALFVILASAALALACRGLWAWRRRRLLSAVLRQVMCSPGIRASVVAARLGLPDVEVCWMVSALEDENRLVTMHDRGDRLLYLLGGDR